MSLPTKESLNNNNPFRVIILSVLKLWTEIFCSESDILHSPGPSLVDVLHTVETRFCTSISTKQSFLVKKNKFQHSTLYTVMSMSLVTTY